MKAKDKGGPETKVIGSGMEIKKYSEEWEDPTQVSVLQSLEL